MLAKIMFIIATILFVILAIGNPDPGSHFLEWGLAATAFGLFLEGMGPVVPVFSRRSEQ